MQQQHGNNNPEQREQAYGLERRIEDKLESLARARTELP
jgi:hypothetical protein